MKKLNVLFINSNDNTIYTDLNVNSNNILYKINVNTTMSNLKSNIAKIKQLIAINGKTKEVNIIFDKNINFTNVLIAKISDIFYNFNSTINIKLYETIINNNINFDIKLIRLINSQANLLLTELHKYKTIVMESDKDPVSYLKYVTENVPIGYKADVKLVKANNFPLINAVRLGSNYDAYFVHIRPDTIDYNKKNLFLVGKAVTYDSGGLNIKTRTMETMKVDMTGSAIIQCVLRLLNTNKLDNNLNIHLFIPIVENMISSKATRPGMVVKTVSNIKVEIIDTDAEGRLCLADCFDWINLNLFTNPIYTSENTLIIDIATLTGSAGFITAGVSSIIMGNNKALTHIDKIIKVGEEVGEYLDYLKLRNEYSKMLSSVVADIRNISKYPQGGCITAGAFLEYFINKDIPWMHIDTGNTTFIDNVAQSHGINLLYEFIKQYANL
jgi:hypothetical protein